jgi:hypothetical protein
VIPTAKLIKGALELAASVPTETADGFHEVHAPAAVVVIDRAGDLPVRVGVVLPSRTRHVWQPDTASTLPVGVP